MRGLQHLDRARLVQPAVSRPVDRTHPSRSEQPLDLVLAKQHSAGGQLGGQNRSIGNIGDYFENSNATQANDTVDRGVAAAMFNDQVRIIRPNPP